MSEQSKKPFATWSLHSGATIIFRSSQNGSLSSNIAIPKVDIPSTNQLKDPVIKPFKIDPINLDELEDIKGALQIQKQNLNEINEPIETKSISVWTIIAYILILMIIILVAIKILHPCNKPKQTETGTSTELQDMVPKVHL